MLTKFISAITRAILIAFVVALPALLLPGVSADTSQVVLLIAIFAAAFVFVEYYASSPSILEFRNAPPFNRLRYVSVLITVFAIASVYRHASDPNALNGLLKSIAALAGGVLDFPYSPVRLVALTMPQDASVAQIEFVRLATGTAYVFSLISIAIFYFLVRALDWPARNGAFNVWVNLPLFDPTVGGDVLPRLTRDGRLNIALGILMPFLFPAFFKVLSDIANPLELTNPQTLIWTVTIWAFFPAGLVMRGIAMLRIATMIDENRKRAYAVAQGLQPV